MKTKRGIVGSIMIGAIGLIVIMIILALFVGFSFIVRTTRKAYGGVENKLGELSNWDEFSKKNALDFLLNCDVEFQGRKIEFYRLLSYFGDGVASAGDVENYLENSECNLYNQHIVIIVNEKNGGIIRCSKNACAIVDELNFGDYTSFVSLSLYPSDVSVYIGGILK